MESLTRWGFPCQAIWQSNECYARGTETWAVSDESVDCWHEKFTDDCSNYKSGIQQKRPRETSSQETAEACPKKKPRAATKKAISHSARNELPAPASKHADDPLPNIPSPIKLIFRLEPKLSLSDSPVEYTVVVNSSCVECNTFRVNFCKYNRNLIFANRDYC